jgi:lauroyl/myristoyl acyltransferase
MKSARHLLEYLAARAVLTLLRLLPRSLAMGVAMAGSRFLFVCLPRLRRIGLRNLELAHRRWKTRPSGQPSLD